MQVETLQLRGKALAVDLLVVGNAENPVLLLAQRVNGSQIEFAALHQRELVVEEGGLYSTSKISSHRVTYESLNGELLQARRRLRQNELELTNRSDNKAREAPIEVVDANLNSAPVSRC